jgi:amino acid transporter
MAGMDEEKGYTGSGESPQYDYGEAEPVSSTAFGRFKDSFKRNPNARVVTEALDAEGRPLKGRMDSVNCTLDIH